jgi:hypothetical protein
MVISNLRSPFKPLKSLLCFCRGPRSWPLPLGPFPRYICQLDPPDTFYISMLCDCISSKSFRSGLTYRFSGVLATVLQDDRQRTVHTSIPRQVQAEATLQIGSFASYICSMALYVPPSNLPAVVSAEDSGSLPILAFPATCQQFLMLQHVSDF